MYREREYFDKLLDLMKEKSLYDMNSRYKKIIISKIYKEYNRIEYDQSIIDGCEDLIGDRIGGIIPQHAMLFKLLRRDFGLEQSDKYVELALDYTLLGCMLDKLVDSKETENKEIYFDFIHNFKLNKKSKATNTVLDKLAQRINKAFIEDIQEKSTLAMEISKLSDMAYKSEYFNATHDIYSKMVSKSQASDKADKFTMVGVMMSLADIGDERRDEMIDCAADIGHIIMLADDLVDVFDDIKEEHLSSIVLNQTNNEFDVEIHINTLIEELAMYVQTLSERICRLDNHLSKETMDYLRYIVDGWAGDINREEEKEVV